MQSSIPESWRAALAAYGQRENGSWGALTKPCACSTCALRNAENAAKGDALRRRG